MIYTLILNIFFLLSLSIIKSLFVVVNYSSDSIFIHFLYFIMFIRFAHLFTFNFIIYLDFDYFAPSELIF